MSDFFNMGGHAGYIWPAYGLVTLVLVALYEASRRFASRNEARLKEMELETESEQNSNET